MSVLTRLVTHFYAPLFARGVLIDGLSIRTSATSEGSVSHQPGDACTPFAPPRGSARASARASHARENRASLAA